MWENGMDAPISDRLLANDITRYAAYRGAFAAMGFPAWGPRAIRGRPVCAATTQHTGRLRRRAQMVFGAGAA